MTGERTGAWTLQRAAAGTGKTVALTRAYLEQITKGRKVEEIVAITFTRRAAAELAQRVSDVLLLCVRDSGPQVEAARRRISDVGIYKPAGLEAVGKAKLERALASLGGAPIGTIDSFIQTLLSEYALDALLDTGDGEPVPIDLPIGEGATGTSPDTEAARALLAPAQGAVGGDVRLLLRHAEMNDLAEMATVGLTRAETPAATFDEVYGALARQVVGKLGQRLGLADVRPALREVVGLDSATEDVEATLLKTVKADGKDAVPAVARWLTAEGCPAPPGELVVALGHLNKKTWSALVGRIGQQPDGATAIDPLVLDVEVEGAEVHLSLEELAKDFPRGFLTAEAKPIVEAFRGALSGLRRSVRAERLRRAARDGALTYDDLLSVATSLCKRAAGGEEPAGLRGRFKALLVDEVQDSSPAQIEFYRGFASLDPAMDCFFVGDARQSIYLFRGAAPAGMKTLADEQNAPLEGLLTNYRSAPELVAAQRELFDGALADAMQREHMQPLESLVGLEAGQNAPGQKRPVTLVVLQPDDGPVPPDTNAVNLAVLDEFADQLPEAWRVWKDQEARKEREGWKERPADPPSAAVLALTWRQALIARDVLRDRLGPDPDTLQPRVFVDGGTEWLKQRVMKDLRTLLVALSNPSDQTAWLGVWKHPMVGLSDRALARVRIEAGRGDQGIVARDEHGEIAPAPAWMGHLGWLVHAEALVAPHDAADIDAFARAREPLRRATGELGRRGAADVLEDLARALRWRTLLAAGPDEDALAYLELALGWIRDLDASGTSVAGILRVLTPSDDDPLDPPRLTLHRPPQHVSCTTVHQAKGLKWDHVCVMSAGAMVTGGKSKDGPLVMRVHGATAPLCLLSARLDPNGALVPMADPIAKLAGLVRKRLAREEALRKAYVAVTRAARTVVLGLPTQPKSGVQTALYAAWVGDAAASRRGFERVQVVDRKKAGLAARPPLGSVAVREGAAAPAEPAPTKGWQRCSPSALDRQRSRDSRRALARRAAEAAMAAGTWSEAGYSWVASPDDDEKEDRTGENVWGDLVHGWLESWRFRGAPTAERVAAYLQRQWGGEDPRIRDWLLRVTTALVGATDHPLWRLVTDPEVELYPELPLLAAIAPPSGDGDDLLLNGRMDLLIRDPRRPPAERWTVIDYKAGKRFPGMPRTSKEPAEGSTQAPEDATARLVRGAHLNLYAPQLEGYGAAVDRALAASETFATERVGSVALWFVRAGAWVAWQPALSDP